MMISGTVLNASSEKRDLVGKDGVVRKDQVIYHVLLQFGDVKEGNLEIVNLRSFNPSYDLPAIGKPWVTPKIINYSSRGDVSEVLV